MQAASFPALYGWQWIKDGLSLFKKQPLAVFTWALAISLLVIIATVIPPIGPLLFIALMPMVTLMTLSVCRHIQAGKTIVPSTWIEPLKEPGIAKKMLGMGALYTGVSITAGLVAFLPFSAELSAGLQQATTEKDLTPFMTAMRIPVVLFGIFYVVIAALFWHAPALVAWHKLKLTQALFFSGIACWRNKWPFVIYGVAWLVIFLFIDLCANLLMAIGLSAELASTLQIPFNIAAGGVLYCSFYPVYTSIFGLSDRSPQLPNE